ncbi:long-chain fatty acid--CoA ligase [Brevibacillus fluminis]|uniref:Long-chain fatty acid--CoA ligase n=1 Tax=Brevibacillus fluminis TaxID=511487 RepID=A0A3M8CZI8_9BACL|nr:long-chain-fatty-acid--CoA ligase [Brevibacillus fluminis]RNB81214.1 long-chain fatty acid--CoA ligase [Brevibacillus fluminis]
MAWILNENLKNAAKQYPQQTACLFDGKRTSYEQLDLLADQFASALVKHGIGKGDKVALLLDNCLQFVIAYYGILRTGAAVVPMNPIYTAREIAYILTNSQAKTAIAGSAASKILADSKQQYGTLELVIFTEAVESEWSFEQFMQEGSELFESASVTEDDLAVILYTSGTTGDPKGAMLTHRNLASNAEATCQLFDLTQKDRVVVVLPVFHVFSMTTCMNASIACGATMLMLPKFSPAAVVDMIRDEKATVFCGVPTMYSFMLQLPQATADDFCSLRLCVSGGAAMPVELLKKFEDKYKAPILEGYGLSESSPVAAFNTLNRVRKPGSIGVEIPGVKIRVVDPDGHDVPTGEVGELIIYGPGVMKGYLGMPEATAAAIKDGWLYTGDMATMDEEGFLFIVDRKKDIILVGGYNVYPREVEEVLYQHPAVMEAAVIGLLDQEYGEIVKAFIVKQDEQLTDSEIMNFCQDKLARYKLPRQIEFLTELPKNRTGKILRRALRS